MLRQYYNLIAEISSGKNFNYVEERNVKYCWMCEKDSIRLQDSIECDRGVFFHTWPEKNKYAHIYLYYHGPDSIYVDTRYEEYAGYYCTVHASFKLKYDGNNYQVSVKSGSEWESQRRISKRVLCFAFEHLPTFTDAQMHELILGLMKVACCCSVSIDHDRGERSLKARDNERELLQASPDVFTAMQGKHPRLGAESPFFRLPPAFFEHILHYVARPVPAAEILNCPDLPALQATYYRLANDANLLPPHYQPQATHDSSLPSDCIVM